jgi:HAD superfamily hydrolase (TIGR01509 family)
MTVPTIPPEKPARPQKTVTAVVFDMDGLMFDTERLACKMWKKAAAEKGYTIPDSIFFEIIGSNVIETERIFKKRYGRDFPYHAIRTTRLYYTDLCLEKDGIPVKDGLVPLLSLLKKKGIKRAVATSTEKARAANVISRAGFLQEFDCIIGGDDVVKSKPEPDIFLEAAKQLWVDPAGCIVLEDSEKGVHAALSAGMFPVMVPDLKPPSSWIINKGIFVCKTLNDVATMLKTVL